MEHPAAVDAPAARFFPFCRRRCRMADLDRWFTGDYCVPGAVEPGVEE